ncbi:hypothetical protein ACET3Z_004181 [Daucus carota]
MLFSIIYIQSEAAVSRVPALNQVGSPAEHPLKRTSCPTCVPTGECCWWIFCCQEAANKEVVTPLNHLDIKN